MDDAGAMLAEGHPTGELPNLSERRRNYQVHLLLITWLKKNSYPPLKVVLFHILRIYLISRNVIILRWQTVLGGKYAVEATKIGEKERDLIEKSST